MHRMLNLMACLKVSVAGHVLYFSVFSAPNLLFCFHHFSARCKILFRVDTPWKSLCRSISTWYTGHNPNMGNNYIQYIASYFMQISYFLLYLLTDYSPKYSLYVSSYVMLWVKNIAICWCRCWCTTLTIVYTLLNSLYYTPYGILYNFKKKKLVTMIRKYNHTL